MLVEPGHDSCLTVAAELNVHLYLFQSLPEHEFASADILVGEEVTNLVEVELGGEVAGHRGDDVPHREAARVELVEDGLPVALKVAPGWKTTCRIGGNGRQHCLYILTPNLGLVEGHVEVLLDHEDVSRLPESSQQVASL